MEKKEEIKKRKGGTVNIVRVSVKASPKAGDAFTQTRLMPAFRVSTGLEGRKAGG